MCMCTKAMPHSATAVCSHACGVWRHGFERYIVSCWYIQDTAIVLPQPAVQELLRSSQAATVLMAAPVLLAATVAPTLYLLTEADDATALLGAVSGAMLPLSMTASWIGSAPCTGAPCAGSPGRQHSTKVVCEHVQSCIFDLGCTAGPLRWSNVTCDLDGRVSGVELDGVDLTGAAGLAGDLGDWLRALGNRWTLHATMPRRPSARVEPTPRPCTSMAAA